MQYVYDTIIKKEQSRLKKYGTSFKLEKRTRMGDKNFYTFVSAGCEPILVVPYFLELYLAIWKKYEKFPKTGTLEKYEARIRKSVSEDIEIEDMPSEIHDDGIMKLFYVRYKEIRLEFEFEDETLTMRRQFTIMENNITGEQETVYLDEESEE